MCCEIIAFDSGECKPNFEPGSWFFVLSVPTHNDTCKVQHSYTATKMASQCLICQWHASQKRTRISWGQSPGVFAETKTITTKVKHDWIWFKHLVSFDNISYDSTENHMMQ